MGTASVNCRRAGVPALQAYLDRPGQRSKLIVLSDSAIVLYEPISPWQAKVCTLWNLVFFSESVQKSSRPHYFFRIFCIYCP